METLICLMECMMKVKMEREFINLSVNESVTKKFERRRSKNRSHAPKVKNLKIGVFEMEFLVFNITETRKTGLARGFGFSGKSTTVLTTFSRIRIMSLHNQTDFS